jgi:hypothetical protein
VLYAKKSKIYQQTQYALKILLCKICFPLLFQQVYWAPFTKNMYNSCLMCCAIVYSKAGCQVRSFLRWQLTLHLFLQAAFIKRAGGEIFQLSLSRPATFGAREKKKGQGKNKQQRAGEWRISEFCIALKMQQGERVVITQKSKTVCRTPVFHFSLSHI